MSSEGKRPSKEEVLAKMAEIRSSLVITKITCTKTVKSRNGDCFVGFSAAYRTFQDDGVGDTHSSSTEDAVVAEQGLSLSDAKLARYALSMECDVAAYESALVNGGITPEFFRDIVRSIRNGYNQLILREMGVITDDSNKG